MVFSHLKAAARAFGRGVNRILGRDERQFTGTSRTSRHAPRPASEPRDLRPRSRRDRLRSLAVLDAKNALGPSFFTRKLNPRTKSRRVAELKPVQRAIAREMGWIL